MLIDQLNLNLIRIFEVVYRTKSMTKAAAELYMTQSGVSQNIKNLEEIIDVVLFDRIKQRTVPTQKAHELYNSVAKHLYGIEEGLVELKEEERTLKGNISIGLPIEYGNNVILPLLTKWGKGHPGINFKIRYGHATAVNQALLEGELDLAIVDAFGMDKQIQLTKIGQEILSLCSSKSYVNKIGPVKNNMKFFEKLEYIDYVEDAPILKQWFRHHFGVPSFTPHIRASLMNVQGMSKMIVEGLGVGILPNHVVEKLVNQGEKIHLFEGSNKPLNNTISLATLKGRTGSPVLNETIKYLVNSLN
ncbi:MAG: LysR family transcriptional regulator [Deltaproteobacteria bacterium]|nr:MAG: LysR family transcriptional regulator [Deltaproteobacteria bacterium]TNF29535.1 MAG: LysR family transcriptional regulator [Deltaproteobacteria bacterium]